MSSSAYLIGSLYLPDGHPSLIEYGKACKPIFDIYGAEPIVVGTENQLVEVLEGHWPSSDAKLSIVKFPSMDALRDCMASNEYQAIKHLRDKAVESHFSLVVG